MSTTPCLVALVGAILLCLTACGPNENAARKSLEDDGFTEIVLTREGDGFAFTAKKGTQSCKGNVSASRYFTSASSFCADDAAADAVPEPVCAAATPGVCFRQGLAKDKAGDHAAALALYNKGCDFGDAGSCTNAGVGYDHGEGAALDRVKAAALFDKACKGKHAVGCSNFGKSLRRDGKPELAIAAFEQACSLELAEGCYLVGMMHMNAATPKKDYAAANAAFEKGCASKEPSQNACGGLGVAHATGQGVTKDAKKGAALLEAACEKGSAESCKNLGVLVRDGLVGPRDPKRASELFEKACPDNVGACNEIALAYERGVGVTKDLPKALSLYAAACDGGLALGCMNYGIALRDGMGLPAKDPKKAREAFGKACQAGEQRACAMEKAIPPSP